MRMCDGVAPKQTRQWVINSNSVDGQSNINLSESAMQSKVKRRRRRQRAVTSRLRYSPSRYRHRRRSRKSKKPPLETIRTQFIIMHHHKYSPNCRCRLWSCILAVLAKFSASSLHISSSRNELNVLPFFTPKPRLQGFSVNCPVFRKFITQN